MTKWHVKVNPFWSFALFLVFNSECNLMWSSWVHCRHTRSVFVLHQRKLESLKQPKYEMQNQIKLPLFLLAVSEWSCNHTYIFLLFLSLWKTPLRGIFLDVCREEGEFRWAWNIFMQTITVLLFHSLLQHCCYGFIPDLCFKIHASEYCSKALLLAISQHILFGAGSV